MLYVKALLEMLQSNRIFQPKKWWSIKVTNQLLNLHLDYNKAFSGNTKHDVTWLNSQKALVKSKFENDQEIVNMK